MKKSLLSLGAICVCVSFIMAQSPQAVPYQGVARDASGNLLVNQTIALRLTVLDGGSPVYQERDTVTTNKLGLFTVHLGTGSVLSGVFNTIAWGGGAGTKSLQVDLDPSGGSSYTALGSSQLTSVPYALYAANAASASSSVNAPITGSGTSSSPLSIAQATASVNGYLASTDWTTFNNKAGGSGTTSYVARWTNSSTPGTLAAGIIQDNGTTAGVGASPSGTSMLTVSGGSSYNGINGATTSTTSGSYGVHGSGATNINAYMGYIGALTNVLGGTVTNPGLYVSNTAGGATNGIYVSSNGTNSALMASSSGGTAGNFMTNVSGGIAALAQNSSATGIGFEGVNTAATGTASGGDGMYGITSQSQSMGLWGVNLNTSGTGTVGLGNDLASVVYLTGGSGGAFTGNGVGMFGYSSSTTRGSTVGGIFETAATTTSAIYIALTGSSGTFYKAYSTGSGSVSESRYTDQGLVTLYCPEAPENKLQDYGIAKMVNGRVTVDIEHLFAQCITFDADNPVKVFLTPHDETRGNLYVKLLPPNQFEIVESGGFTDNMDVDYMIVATPRGREGFRFNQEFVAEGGKLVPAKTFEDATKFGNPALLKKYSSVRDQMVKEALPMGGAFSTEARSRASIQ